MRRSSDSKSLIQASILLVSVMSGCPATADIGTRSFPIYVFDADKDCTDPYWGSLQGCSATQLTIAPLITSSEVLPYSSNGVLRTIIYKTSISYDFSCAERLLPEATITTTDPASRFLLSLNEEGALQRQVFFRMTAGIELKVSFAITKYDTVKSPCRLVVFSSSVVPEIGHLSAYASTLIENLKDADRELKSIEMATIPSEKAKLIMAIPSSLDWIISGYKDEVENLRAEVSVLEDKLRDQWTDYEAGRYEVITASDGLLSEIEQSARNAENLKRQISENLSVYENCGENSQSCEAAVFAAYRSCTLRYEKIRNQIQTVISFLDAESLRNSNVESEPVSEAEVLSQRLTRDLNRLTDRTHVVTGDVRS